MPEHKSRLTTVTGQSREEAEAERRRTQHQSKFPSLRSANEAARHNDESARIAAMPQSPSGLVGAGQAHDAVRAAVAGAVEGVHDFYRRRMGDDAFNSLHGKSGALPEGWTPQDAGDSAGASTLTGRGDGQPRFIGPDVEVDAEHGYRRIGNRVAESVGGEAADTIVDPGDRDVRPIGIVTPETAPEPVKKTPAELLGADSTQQDDGGVVGGGGGRDGDDEGESDGGKPNLLSRVASAVGLKGDSQPAGGQASAGTPEGGKGEEDSPPKHRCDQCDFVAGSERGLKAHKTAKHG